MLVTSLSPKIRLDDTSEMSGKPFESIAWSVPWECEAVFHRAWSTMHALGNHARCVLTKSICPSCVQGLGV